MDTIKITHEATDQTFFRKWHPRKEEFHGEDHGLPEDMWLDIELALCDKRRRGFSEGYRWEIVEEVYDYRWIGLGIVRG